MRIRWLALTGTPGVGKSTLANALRREGFEVLDGNRFAEENGCFSGRDRRRGSHIVDTVRVARALAKLGPSSSLRVLDAHWSHAVRAMDAALVLRLHPRRLAARLARRGWSPEKVRENVEAEALDLILQESAQAFGPKRVGEIDTTKRSRREVAEVAVRALRAPERELMKLEIGRIDWSEELLKWS